MGRATIYLCRLCTQKKLPLTIPDVLRQMFLTKGHSSLGTRPAAMFFLALVIALLAWRPDVTASAQQQSLLEANKLYAQQDYAAAAAKYEEALIACNKTGTCTDPTISLAYFYQGNAYDNLYRPTRRGDPDNDALLERAIEKYRMAAEVVTDPRIRKLALEYLVAAYGPDKLNDPSQAELLLIRVIELQPDDVAGYFGLAKVYEDAGYYDDAEQTFLKAQQVRPNDHIVYLQLAAFYNRQGDFDKTMKTLNERVRVEPNNPDAYYTMATYYWDAAYRDFRLSDQAKLQYVLQGIDAVNKAIEIKPDYIEALAYKNLLLRLQADLEKDPAKARDLLRQADELREKALALRKK